MNILEQIKIHKINEVAKKKSNYPIKLLEQSDYIDTPCISLKQSIQDPERSGIIAEFKRKSPSKGYINEHADVEHTTVGYIQAGAVALSVLTDEHYFGAQTSDFNVARASNNSPILQKDFILDEYQIIEAKANGADAILLIMRMLDVKELKSLARFAHSLGLEVFLETHNAIEIESSTAIPFDIIGINNRNLNTFKVDIQNSIQLAAMLPIETVKVAESGIQSIHTIKELKNNGFNGFLMGEYFMKHSNPEKQCKELIQQLT